MKFTYYGHSCFQWEINGYKILFDPFISGNPLIKDFDIQSLHPDFIFISHGHVDHILDAVKIAKNSGAKVISSWEIYEWLQKQGIENLHPMNTGGAFNFDFGRLKCTAAQHSSGLPDGSYGGNPMGCVVYSTEGNFYYSGDTALTLDMQLIPRWGVLKACFMPIGDNFTMGYEDVAIASEFVQCQNVIGVHFDTFGFIVIDKEAVYNHFKERNKNLLLPEIGQTYEV